MAQNNRPDYRHHILGTASNLLGICFVLITGLKITNGDDKTYADEICFFTSFLLLASCLLSYLSIRNEGGKSKYERGADYCFILSILSLFAAMIVFVAGQ